MRSMSHLTSPHPPCQANETLSIITNDAIIAVNQDAVGSPANRIYKRPAAGGGYLSLYQGNLANKCATPLAMSLQFVYIPTQVLLPLHS